MASCSSAMLSSPSSSTDTPLGGGVPPSTSGTLPQVPTGYLSVPQFYADKCVFITGGTGFMGKVLVEKLLRSCPGVRNIYLLIRSKRGQSVQSRLQELLDSPLFDKLRRERPADLQKIVPIVGDVTEPDLGIGQADQNLLCRQVHIVFHSAATVKFDEKLKLSVAINMLGTKRMVELCHRMNALEALVHVSTAYCNCDRETVDEVIYPPPYDPDHVIELVQWMPEELLDRLTPGLIGRRPNTYTFTKALAEHMLLTSSGGLNVAIVRPSIVLSSHREPVAGWVDNWNGPTGIISAVGKGFFRTIICHDDKVADLVPVDTVINLLVVAAWKTAMERKDNITVYNCCTGQQKPITWKRFVEISIDNMRAHPLDGCIWYPTGTLRSNKLMNKVVSTLVHTMPAYVMDAVARVAGKRPIMGRVQSKLSKAVECLEYFTTQQWRFSDVNVQRLNVALTSADRATFPFDVNDVHWPTYVESYVLGVRRFMFKETKEQGDRAKVHMMRLYWLHQLSKMALVLLSWRFLYKRSRRLQTAWSGALEFLARLLRLAPFAV